MGATMLKILVADAAVPSADPTNVLACVNRRYVELSLEDDFATMVLFRLPATGGAVTGVSAGHESALLIRPGPVEPSPIESTGPPIGIESALKWTSTSVDFGPRDCLVLMTDGVVEALNPAHEAFGRERLMALARSLRGEPVEKVVAAIHQALLTHLAGQAAADDMTVVAIVRAS